jgi:hypothetical protein
MLFLLIMEVLHTLIRKGDAWSLFQPLGPRPIPFCTSLYVDDLILFLSPISRDLRLAHCIFYLFHGASGLTCNIQKCQMVPIRCSEDQIELAHSIFPCQFASLPMTYLSLPLSVHQLPKLALQPMLDNMADRLQSWKGKLLNRTGRQALIKSTLATIPIYTAISIKLPPGSAKLWRRL